MSVDRYECQPERWSDPPDYEDEEPEEKVSSPQVSLTVDDLIQDLKQYAPEQQVKIFDDWGSSFVLRPITGVIESTEWSQDQPVIALTFDVEKQ